MTVQFSQLLKSFAFIIRLLWAVLTGYGIRKSDRFILLYDLSVQSYMLRFCPQSVENQSSQHNFDKHNIKRKYVRNDF